MEIQSYPAAATVSHWLPKTGTMISATRRDFHFRLVVQHPGFYRAAAVPR